MAKICLIPPPIHSTPLSCYSCTIDLKSSSTLKHLQLYTKLSRKMHSRALISLFIFTFILYSSPQVVVKAADLSLIHSSSFSIALQTLQNQINYTFDDIGLLRRAMTHASYSEENNKVLSILGENVIETSVAMAEILKNIDISTKDLSERIADMSKVDTSCAVDGTRLGLQKIIRVSSKTDSSTPSVVCGAFRAIFGAISMDSMSADSAGKAFMKVHHGSSGMASAS